MGLASALTTALTGLTAAETQIDVVGNNLSNAQTIGFKASTVNFATQFLQTQSLGSAPNSASGGTNPLQIGLGTRVAEVTPDFTQGTIEISSNPSDLAIQGDGFFIIENGSGEQLYTRNGVFKTNSTNELVTVTGDRLLGYGVDDDFNIQETVLEPITIPFGEAAVAQPTTNVELQGTLTPTGDVANTAEVIQSVTLGDAAAPQASAAGASIGASTAPGTGSITVSHNEGPGTHTEGSVYQYRFAYVDSTGSESPATGALSVTVPGGNGNPDNAIQLNSLPAATGDYNEVRIYRTSDGGSNYFLLDSVAAGSNYVDDNSVALSSTPLDESSISGNYSYMVTYFQNGSEESRPTPVLGPVNVDNGRIQLSNLPTPPTPGPNDNFPAYDQIRIYRNLSTDPSTYYLVDTVAPGATYTDSRTDAEISDLSNSSNKVVDLDGPKIDGGSLLTNVVQLNGSTYESVFQEGTLEFEYRKGGRSIPPKTLEITSTTTVQELIDFMDETMGVFQPGDDPSNPIPTSINNIPGESGTLTAGGSIVNGQLRFVSNNGVDNALDIGLSGFRITPASGIIETPNLNFGAVQQANGQSATTDFVVFDSLGIPLNVRVTAVLEERTGSATTYRWFAESPDNDPLNGNSINAGTGLISFDGEGSFLSATNSTVAINRSNIPSTTPLEFNIDFTNLSGLAAEDASIAATQQDGAPAGTLSDFIVGEDGLVRGVFTNGNTRDLGQIRLAKFTNPAGLEQKGQNAFAAGINSGISFINPGAGGGGKLIAGAVELSNSDIGENLVDLVLATTFYRGNTRVISTSQQLLDELLNLRR